MWYVVQLCGKSFLPTNFIVMWYVVQLCGMSFSATQCIVFVVYGHFFLFQKILFVLLPLVGLFPGEMARTTATGF